MYVKITPHHKLHAMITFHTDITYYALWYLKIQPRLQSHNFNLRKAEKHHSKLKVYIYTHSQWKDSWECFHTHLLVAMNR